MLLFEAKEIIGKRKFPAAYEGMTNSRSPKNEADSILLQGDADIMAIRCIEAQMRLSEILNDYWSYTGENDTMPAHLVYELLSGIRFDAKFDEDGAFDLEATEGNETDPRTDKPV